jgi:multidrug efflux pump subunit AcrB
MENTAAVPLEDALAKIRGMKTIRSVSENGVVRVFVCFDEKHPGRYEAVREAAQEIYKTLPSSAQRPEIVSADGNRIPVWTVAVYGFAESSAGKNQALGTFLERNVKPALEAVPGAGEVELSGAALTEIIITLDEHKAASLGLNPHDVISSLAYNDGLFPGGVLREGDREIFLVVDGRYGDTQSLAQAIIPFMSHDGKRLIRLNAVASVRETEKETQSRSRLNGKSTAVIAVMAGGGADIGKLSTLLYEELQRQGLEFTVLSDRGAEEKAARRSVFGAAIQGSLAVALIAALMCRESGRLLLCVSAFSVPVIVLLSAATLRLLNFALDTLILAGLSTGSGAAVDAVILSAEYLGKAARSPDRTEGRQAFAALKFPLISGAATTIIALFPLILKKPAAAFQPVAWAAAVVNAVSLVLALTVLPPLFLYRKKEQSRGKTGDIRAGKTYPAFQVLRRNLNEACKLILSRRTVQRKAKRNFFTNECNFLFLQALKFLCHLQRRDGTSHSTVISLGNKSRRSDKAGNVFRFLAFLSGFCIRRSHVIIGFWLVMTVFGAAALFIKGADTGVQGSENSVYAQVEFEGGLHIDEVDRRLKLFAKSLDDEGIVNIQTSARTGSGSVLLNLNPRKMNHESAKKRLRSRSLPGGFVYIAEPSGGDRIWEIRISGGGKHCRKLAAEAARICEKLPVIEETVLNFKDGRPRLTLKPDRERFAESGFSLSGAGRRLRYGIHGPVGYKRVTAFGETDVRLRWGMVQSAGDIRLTPVAGNSLPVRAESLFTEHMDREPSSIQRIDRRRSASISVRTKAMDPRKAQEEIMTALSVMSLPPGYSIEFDPEAIEAAEEVSSSVFLFVLALALCYMVIAALKESFLLPLAVLAVVPPSLAVPALCTAALPLNAAGAAAFVAASGLAVNAAILMADGIKVPLSAARLYRTFRNRFPVLAAAAFTTIAGAVPFLFTSGGAAPLVKPLSAVTALGAAASALCSVSLIPALASAAPGFFCSVDRSPSND